MYKRQEYDTGLDLKKLNVVRAHFAKLREKYLASGQLSPKMLGVDANTLLYQVPGGMLSNLLKQLKDAGKEDQLDTVLAAVSYTHLQVNKAVLAEKPTTILQIR